MSEFKPLTETEINAAVSEGRASFNTLRAPGVSEKDVTQEMMREILANNMNRLANPAAFAVDVGSFCQSET